MITIRRSTAAVMVLSLALVVLWQYRPIDAQEVSVPSDLKIGVVNVTKVLMECQENLDREKESLSRNQQIKSKLAELGRQADDIRQELENVLEPGSDEYLKRLQDWFDKSALVKSYEEGQKQTLASESQAWTEALYQKLLDQTAQMARLEDVSLILDKDVPPEKPRNLSEVYALIRSRKVIYSSSVLDITARVLEGMDRAYEMEKAAKSNLP